MHVKSQEVQLLLINIKHMLNPTTFYVKHLHCDCLIAKQFSKLAEPDTITCQ